MIAKIRIIVEARPSRYLVTKYGIAPTKDHKDYIKTLVNSLNTWKGLVEDVEIPLKMEIIYMIAKPRSSKREYPTGRPDLDNLSKPMLDALKPQRIKRKVVSEGVIADDSQIVRLESEKKYTNKQSRIIISIWTLPQKTIKKVIQQSQLEFQ